MFDVNLHSSKAYKKGKGGQLIAFNIFFHIKILKQSF